MTVLQTVLTKVLSNLQNYPEPLLHFTCVVAVLMGIFLLRYCCIKKRQQNLLRMQRNVQEAVQVVVAPHAARLPVLSGPPPSAHPPIQPAYPLQELPPYSAQKTTPEQIGAAVMKNYM